MTSIHPSEDPPLGWCVPCLAVRDIQTTLDFYAKMDLLPYGGNPADGWSMLRNRAIEIHVFEGRHIDKDLVNLRGGDLPRIREVLAARGFETHKVLGEHSFIYLDPDGREVFFDSSPEETAEYESGQRLTGLPKEADVHAGTGLDLGNLTWCLACGDLGRTSVFYERLGFVPGDGEPEKGRSLLARRDHLPGPGIRLLTTTLTLCEGTIPADTLSFRGGHVAEIASALQARGLDIGAGVQRATDGGESLLLVDPDDHPLFFDTPPSERLYRR